MKLPAELVSVFAGAVRTAAGRDEVRRAVGHLYTAVQDAIDLRRPVCNASGRCCKFDEFGHQLFVTTIELAAFLRELAAAPHPNSLPRVRGRGDQIAMTPSRCNRGEGRGEGPEPADDSTRAETQSGVADPSPQPSPRIQGEGVGVALIPEIPPGGCPFQIDGLCSVHTIRPFGCRIFFCDETAQGWQQDQYARFHAELKRLHEALGVPYFYVEWRDALRALAETGG